jgi:uncharacterized protein (DUF427 family)
MKTGCAYKGFPRYWRLAGGPQGSSEIAWSYPTPFPEVAKIAGMIAFYNERVSVTIDGVRSESVEMAKTGRGVRASG